MYDPRNYFDYTTVPGERLISSQEYQRDICKGHVKGTMDDFDPYQINPVKVAIRDGRYYVFDGQHTLTALIARYGTKVNVPTMIFKNISPEIEARLFANQDSHKRKVGIADKLKALYIAKDPFVVEFHDVCERQQFVCDFIQTGTKKMGISSYGYLYHNVYMKYGSSRLETILRIIRSAWDNKDGNTNGFVLKGLNSFINHYLGEYSESTLINALKRIPIKSIKINGDSDNTRTGDERYGAQIYTIYNKSAKTDKKLPLRF